MPTNATAVTRLNHDEHIADTGVERNIFLEIFFVRARCRQLALRAQLQNRPVMPREGGASSNDGLAITGSPAFAGDDG
jgi:hypothetical protein